MLRTLNAASISSIKNSAFFNVLHKTCVKAKPTEVTRLTWVKRAKVVTYLYENGKNGSFLNTNVDFLYL